MTPMFWPDMVASCGSPEIGPHIINIYTSPAYLDPDAHLYNQYHSGQWGSYNSCSFYKNEEVDAMLDDARSKGDAAKREEMYTAAQKHIAADQPAVWMYTENSVFSANQCVKGYEFRSIETLVSVFPRFMAQGLPVRFSDIYIASFPKFQVHSLSLNLKFHIRSSLRRLTVSLQGNKAQSILSQH